MKLPGEVRRYCKFCKTHTLQKVVQVKGGHRGVLTAGSRRKLYNIEHEYEFIIVSKPANKTEISKICLTPNIDSAPYIIVVICDPEKLKAVFGLEYMVRV